MYKEIIDNLKQQLSQEKLNEIPINEIKNMYGKELCVEESFWLSKKDSNYATLIIIDKIIKLNPFHISKKGMQTWIKFKK